MQWVADLAKYDLQIHYRSWKININADALSRIPWDCEEKLISMDSVMVQAVVARGVQNSCTIPEDWNGNLHSHWASSGEGDPKS